MTRRRVAVPATLAVIAVLAGFLAVRAGADPADGGGTSVSRPSAGRGAATPVLSARRVPAWLAAPGADAALRAELGGVIEASPAETCLTVSVGGRTLFEHQPDAGLTPASVQKLATATTVLEVLGPETRLTTEVVAGDEPSDGRVEGDLFLVGGGDPLLATEDYAGHFRNQPQIHTPLGDLADRVVEAGITEVTGRVIGDESRYDDDRYPDAWPPRYAEQHQSGPLSALNVNDGFTDWPPVQQANFENNVAAADPPANAASVFAGLLAERGVAVGTDGGAGLAPAGAVELASIRSPPMTRIVEEMLSESDNTTAELLVREMGRAAGEAPTSSAGLSVVTEALVRLGLTTESTELVDGSGLSESNRLSCGVLMGLLDRTGPRGAVATGLAVAGEEGTLAERFESSPARGRLRAKTGSLNQVASLAGFVDATAGPTLTFAYIATGRYYSEGLLDIQTALAEDLVAYPPGPPLATLGPVEGP